MADRTDIRVEPCKIRFKWPWSDRHEDIYGILIRRILPADASPTLVDAMDENTPRPEILEVKCVAVAWERIDDHRFLETSTWIPML